MSPLLRRHKGHRNSKKDSCSKSSTLYPAKTQNSNPRIADFVQNADVSIYFKVPLNCIDKQISIKL